MTVDDRDHCCTAPPATRRAQPPGQTSLRTRVGTWAEFRERMVAGLTTQTVTPEGETEAQRPLQALTTRQSDDGTIALLDAWAAACDVLAFYDERILEEGYLGTAKERRSLVEIANALGYEPSPGVAAAVRLCFEIQDTPLTSGPIALDEGIAVMSVPPEGELPQTYETVEAIEAYAAYNAIPARQTTVHMVGVGSDELWLEGVGTGLQPGQRIVIAHPLRPKLLGKPTWSARVISVEVDTEGQRTQVRFAPAIAGSWPAVSQPLVIAFRQRAGIFGHNAPEFAVVGEDARVGALVAAGWSESFAKLWQPGWGWPDFWVGAGVEPNRGGVHLEREVDAIAPDTWVYLEDEGSSTLGRVTEVEVMGRSRWTLSARVTSVSFDLQTWMPQFSRRGTSVHFASEVLPTTGAPDTSTVAGLTLDLDHRVPPMEVGRAVIVEGETLGGSHYVLETTVAQWSGGDQPTVTLRDAIAPPLRRTTVKLLGNVALATHGKTEADTVIGSGDATAVNQRFSLRAKPLTWVSAASGAEAELELRIDGVLWTRVDSLFYAGPDDRVYTVETAEDGSSEVVLGDGIRGARASTGVDNVVASMRVGIGQSGEVDSDRLTLLQTRPQGLFAVRNPSAARGGADAESLDDVRTHAPLHVLTLDRLVSLADYGDYARAFPGIGKARAVELWDGRRAFIHLTVAAASGEAFADTDPLLTTLREAIATAQDPTHTAVLAGHEEVRFDVRARLLSDPAYERDDVEQRVRAELLATFAFERRGFGQPVAVSEVAAVIHGVAGVVAVDVDSVHRHGELPQPSRAVLRAALPRWTGAAVSKAELLLLRELGITLLEMSA